VKFLVENGNINYLDDVSIGSWLRTPDIGGLNRACLNLSDTSPLKKGAAKKAKSLKKGAATREATFWSFRFQQQGPSGWIAVWVDESFLATSTGKE